MKTFILFLAIAFTLSCSNDFNENIEPRLKITTRKLPNYIIPYQYPSGDIETMTSSDLQTWSPGYTASTTASKYGTSSTIYNFAVPDTERRCLTIFQNSSNDLKWVEYEDGDNAWSSPASISTATSPLLPSVEMNDGVVYEVHQDGSSGNVKGSYKNGGSWVTPYNLMFGTSPFNLAQIPTDYSPSLEYHPTAAVEYLVTGYLDSQFSGGGLPVIYWRYTNSYYTPTSAPSVSTGRTSNDFNSSFTPVAVSENGNDKLYLFYTAPGNDAGGLTIRYIVGSVAGGYDGSLSWCCGSSITGAYTDHKIDGFYESNSGEIVIAYRNYQSGEIDLAISGNFGSSWSFETGIEDVSGAPSIVNLD